MRIDKKGVLRVGILVLIVVMLLFFIVNGILSFGETAEEEKARLEAELMQLEQELEVISAGFNFSNQIADAHNLASVANVTTNGSVNQFVDDSDLVFDGNSVYYLFSSENGKCSLVVVKSECGLMAEEVLKIKLRIEEIKSQLEELEVSG